MAGTNGRLPSRIVNGVVQGEVEPTRLHGQTFAVKQKVSVTLRLRRLVVFSLLMFNTFGIIMPSSQSCNLMDEIGTLDVE